MELWVRSQDREKMLSNPILIVDDNKILTPKNDYRDTHLLLGHYKTKERALEVLDEIQDILKPKIEITKVGEPLTTIDGKILYVNQESEMKYQEVSTYVYEMPEE